MKKLIIFISVIAFFGTTIAQSHTGEVAYQKTDHEVIINEVPFSPEIIMNAIQDTLEKLGYKGKDSKGFMVYKGVKLPVLGNDTYDLYFSVEKISRKEKDISRVTLMISKGFDSFITEKTEPGLVHNAETYLDSLRNTVAVYDIRQQIAEQEGVVKKIEKKITGLTEDADDLQKKKKKIEKEIEENSKEQSNQGKELEKQKQILETLKNKG